MWTEKTRWHPGSFTKNFSWGQGLGLLRLHEHIRIGFDGKLEDVERSTYRERVKNIPRSELVPINLFLFNERREGKDYILIDELVFQALTTDHSPRFDALALVAFNLSLAGIWRGALAGQRYPALYALHYVAERVARDFKWDASVISADDIEKFLLSSPRYTGETTRKVATNLNFLYKSGNLGALSSNRVERWWVDALFLALDRIAADRHIEGLRTKPSDYLTLLRQSRFLDITGPSTPEKLFAMGHLTALYRLCGGMDRFSEESVKGRIAIQVPDYVWQEPNDPRPQGALHPTNPRILKTIPRACAVLAVAAGFEIVYADDLESFDPSEYVNIRANNAVADLGDKNIRATMTAEELGKLMRGE